MHWIDRLSEYHDDELSSREREACETHLQTCNECRTAFEQIALVARTAQIHEDVAPPTNLWPSILARIQTQAGPGVSMVGQRSFGSVNAPRRVSFTLPELALAASLLVAVSSAVAYLAADRMLMPPAPPREAPIQAVAEPVMPPSADVAPANFADAQFDQAVADLERILLEQRDQLDPGTVMVIERNLAAIDAAIRDSRTALEADPANTFLNSHLAEARRRKLDLLRHATTLNSSGD